MEYLRLTSEDAELFRRDGFFFKRGFFDGEEISLMRRALEEDATLAENILSVPDEEWGATDEIVWNQPGDDLFGAISRCARVVEGMELLFGDAVYHYHAKFILKPPRRAAAFAGIRTSVIGMRTESCFRTWPESSSPLTPCGGTTGVFSS